MSFHPNDEQLLRDMMNLRGGDAFPPSAAGIYARARHLSERIGTGTMQPAALIYVVMQIQDAEKAAGRPVPGLPPQIERPVPQHQRLPKSMQQALESEQEPEKRGPGRPRKEQPASV